MTAALETVRRSRDGVAAAPSLAPTPGDPQWLFADLLGRRGQTALLLDDNGYVLGGLYVDDERRMTWRRRSARS